MPWKKASSISTQHN
jgi:hypothetical protein